MQAEWMGRGTPAKKKPWKSEPDAMGFKDKQKALDTLKMLEGRDISYQFHVIKNFVSRAKKTLVYTRAKKKLENIREAQQIFEDWLKDYKENNRGKDNLAYLRLETVKGFRPLAKAYGVLDDSFYLVYKREKGEYRGLRTVKSKGDGVTWDIVRNRKLKDIIAKMKKEDIQWYETADGDFRSFPSKEHVQCILLGYSPYGTDIRKFIPLIEKKFGTLSDAEDMEVEDEDEEDEDEDRGTGTNCKRSRDSSSSSGSEDDEPRKKTPKKEQEPEKQEKEESGLSFKDKQKALDSIKSLDGRDVSYQYHAITGLLKRADRVISCTKDEEKIKNMKEAVEVFENWVTDYNVNNRSKENFAYLPADLVRAYKPLADKYGIEDNGFLKAYEEEDGDYKRLRSVNVPDSQTTWDIERNKNLRSLVHRIKDKHIPWFETDSELRGLPTEEHTRCIMWGFSHDPTKLKKLVPTLKEKINPSE